jgi:hypothetical protein
MVLDDTDSNITGEAAELGHEPDGLKDKIAGELTVLRARNAVLDAEQVVEFARDPSTALHRKFNWDDSDAAHQYRIWQARQLIAVYIQVIDRGDGSKAPARAFVNVKATGEASRGYRPTSEVLNDADARHALVVAQIERLRSIYQSYPLVELEPIGKAIEQCRKAYS